MHAAAYGKIAADFHVTGLTGVYQIIQNLIDYRFVKDAFVAKVEKVVFQRF
jgi:hypothetical protein